MFVILRRWGITLITLAQLSSRIIMYLICFFLFCFKVTELICKSLYMFAEGAKYIWPKSNRAIIHMVDVKIDVEPLGPVV